MNKRALAFVTGEPDVDVEIEPCETRKGRVTFTLRGYDGAAYAILDADQLREVAKLCEDAADELMDPFQIERDRRG